MQDGETGEFTLTVLMESDLSFFLPLIIVSAVALLIFALCIGIAALLSKKKEQLEAVIGAKKQNGLCCKEENLLLSEIEGALHT